MNKNYLMKKIVLIFFFLFSVVGFSQESLSEKLLRNKTNSATNKTKKDLKVGLVLSGGGAKGFAHIGVLNILEEIGIRVDYVGGTSAGAMIGGLYASGYSAKQIDSIIRSYDFNELIQDKIPRNQFTLFQKENSEKYALTLPIKNWQIGLPLALSKGQNMLNELTKLTKHVHNINDFTKLPIPFYCVATDIETGEKVILEDGFLPLAIKASGAFPTLFEPVEINNRLLVDGGIVDNFPVDIMEAKDMDIIIGVDVQDNLGTRKNLDSAPKIIMQIISFQMYTDAEKHKDITDVYIRPNISNYNVLSFDKIAEIIDEGERVTLKEKEYLEAIALQQIKKPVNNNIIVKSTDKIYIESIEVTGHENYTRNYILSKLNLKGKDSITYNEFNHCVKGLSATGNFKSIDYKFTALPNNKSIISFNLKENDISNSLHLGVHYDDLYKTGVLVNFTSKHALTNNDIFSFDAIFGDNLRYNLDYIVDNGFYWQFGFKSRYNSFKRNFIIDKTNNFSIFSINQQLKYSDFSNQLYLQSKFKERIGLKIGLEHKYIRVFTDNDITNSKDFFDNRSYYNIFGEIILDTYDSKNFTKKGFYFKADYKLYFASSKFDKGEEFNAFSQLKAKFGYAYTFLDKLTIQSISNMGLTIGDNTAVFNYFLGGNNENFINNFVPFYGYDIADMSNTAFIQSAATLRYEIITKNYISFTGNVAGVNKNIFTEGSVFEDLKTGYAIGIGNKSIIGPIELKYAWSPDNNQSYWYFNIGFWF